MVINLQVFGLPQQGIAMDAKIAGGPGSAAVRSLEGGQDVLAFESPDGACQLEAAAGLGLETRPGFRKRNGIGRVVHVRGAEPFDQMLKFPYAAGPIAGPQMGTGAD